MVDLVLLQVVRDLVAIFGVIAGFVYYVLTVRNAQKTRRAQLFSVLLQRMDDVAFWRYYHTVTRQLPQMTYDEALEMFRTNPDTYGGMMALTLFFHHVGYLVRSGLLSMETVEENMSTTIIRIWESIEHIREEHKRRTGLPESYRHFKYLYDEMKKSSPQRNPELKT